MVSYRCLFESDRADGGERGGERKGERPRWSLVNVGLNHGEEEGKVFFWLKYI